MQTTENGSCSNSAIFRNAMPLGLNLCLRSTRIRYSWPKTGVWAGAVVMSHPGFEGLPNACLVDRNHEIQPFTSCRSNVRKWHSPWAHCKESSKQSALTLLKPYPNRWNRCDHGHG